MESLTPDNARIGVAIFLVVLALLYWWVVSP